MKKRIGIEQQTLKIFVGLFIILSTFTACAPDNVLLCEDAQSAIDKAYKACDSSLKVHDLSCEVYEGTDSDCTEYFSKIENSLLCEDKKVTFEYGPACN